MKTPARSIVIILILSFATAIVPAKPNEFKAVVNHFKNKYHAKQMRIPFVFGLVGLGARFYTKGAIKGLKIAIFPDQDLSHAILDRSFDTTLANSFDTNWTPMVRTYSKKDPQRTILYAKEDGKDMQVILASIEKDNGVVVSFKINPGALARFIEKHQDGESIIGELGLGSKENKNSDSITVAEKEKSSANAATENDASVVADAPVNKLPEVKSDESVATNKSEEKLPAADITVNTKLVNLNARVINNTGKPIVALNKEDFALYENSVKQEIAYFTPVTAPVNLVLLLDYSGSTNKKKDIMKEAAKKFVDSLGANDRVSVAVFGRKVKVISDFTADKKALKKLIGKIDYDGSGTAYYDSMWKTLDMFKAANGRRNAIVVLTDGVDNSISRPKDYPVNHPFNELFERIAEEDVTIYPLYLDTEYETVVKHHGSDTHETYTIAKKQLQEIAEQTGGQVFHVATIEDLSGVYDRVAAELKNLYSIAYSSTNDDTATNTKKDWREIKVVVGQKDSVVRTKRGYFAK